MQRDNQDLTLNSPKYDFKIYVIFVYYVGPTACLRVGCKYKSHLLFYLRPLFRRVDIIVTIRKWRWSLSWKCA